ncbi:MAG: HAMP domain-containing sensor histidine kinase [Nitriliruptorales bacterium]|nr:HAMP domain-containing sensor histidine kinase [Nitriliruptorales bacterium]
MTERANDPGAMDVASGRAVGMAFAWRTAAVFLVVGVISHFVLQNLVTDHFRNMVEFHAEFISENLVSPIVAGERPELRTDAERQARLQEHVERDRQVLTLRVLEPDGEVALAPTEAPDVSDLSDHGLVVTTVPIANPPGFEVEVVQDWDPSAAAADDLTRSLDLILGAGLLLTWLALLPTATRLGRDLRSRTSALERQSDRLQTLLDREQETVRRLHEANELKDHFLSAVSHELRTPLTVVKGALATIHAYDDRIDQKRRCDLVARAHRNADKLDELLDGLLDLNRSHIGGGDADRQMVALREVIADAVSHLPPRPLDLDLQVERMAGDPLQLERIVANLVGNAIRHAPGPEPIEIGTRREGNEVEITVSDRGPGVPDDLKQAIFDPFRQGDISDRHSPGTGIGLSLVARFAKAHGGRAWVTDRAGGGATFHVRIAGQRGTDHRSEPQAARTRERADELDGGVDVPALAGGSE